MHFEQFYLGCLAHASYMIVSGDEAVIVDPQRDIEMYLVAAKQHNAQIRHVFETHLHADFVSGHKELAARTGATIYIGPNGGATVSHQEVREGFELKVGAVKIKVLETPGHTPESICLLITDEEKSPEPWAVLTGDTLFVGDVGRPDLSKVFAADVLAGMLFDSLHSKLLTLPDATIVYPGHGAGSLCGRSLGAARSSTIATERLTNYALQIKSREEFVHQLTVNLPPRPEYFPLDAQINRAGAPALAELAELNPVGAEELRSLMEQGAIALDVRAADQFAAAHVPGSINIPLSGQLATWAGTVIGLDARPVLIADTPEELTEARVRLARIGLDEERGFLVDGIRGWSNAGFAVASFGLVTVRNLSRALDSQKTRVLDVRRRAEWQAGHVENVAFQPLDEFKAALPDLDRSAAIAVMCKSGYRSSIACSLLLRAGFQNVTNVIGGFDAWQKASLPFVEEPVAA